MTYQAVTITITLGLKEQENSKVFSRQNYSEEQNLLRGALGSIKNRKTALKITQNRKTAIDFDQNRKPHAKPSKPKIYTAQFSPNPSLDLKRW